MRDFRAGSRNGVRYTEKREDERWNLHVEREEGNGKYCGGNCCTDGMREWNYNFMEPPKLSEEEQGDVMKWSRRKPEAPGPVAEWNGRKPGAPGPAVGWDDRKPGAPGPVVEWNGRKPGAPEPVVAWNGRKPGAPGPVVEWNGRKPGAPGPVVEWNGRKPGAPDPVVEWNGRKPGAPDPVVGWNGRKPGAPGRVVEWNGGQPVPPMPVPKRGRHSLRNSLLETKSVSHSSLCPRQFSEPETEWEKCPSGCPESGTESVSHPPVYPRQLSEPETEWEKCPSGCPESGTESVSHPPVCPRQFSEPETEWENYSSRNPLPETEIGSRLSSCSEQFPEPETEWEKLPSGRSISGEGIRTKQNDPVLESRTGMPYIRYDYEDIIEEEKQMEKDLHMLQSMYPEAVKEILPYVEEICDRMEYEGSMMFDEYPDKNTVRRLSDEIYEQTGDVWPREPVQEPDGVMSMQYQEGGRGPLGELIQILLLQEMHHRRCRRRRCRPHMF